MKFLILIALIFAQSCSSTYRSLNEISQSEVDFKTGRFQEKSWSESMIFQRTSWFKGATLGYDVLLHRLNKNSPFTNWLEESEKEYIQNCNPLVIGLFYTNNNSPTTIAKLVKEITNQKYQEINLLNFKEYVQNHPSFQLYNLWGHKLVAFCGRQTIDGNKNIYISVPNYEKTKVLD